MKKPLPTLLALTIFILGCGMVFGQNEPDPFRPGVPTARPVDPATKAKKVPVKKDSFVKDPAAKAASEQKDSRAEIGILIEYIRLDHKIANRLIRTHAASGADAQSLRDELEELIETDKATLDDSLWIRAKSGQRAKSESITERIYPTEYDPPEIPNNTGSVAAVKSKDQQAEADRQANALNEMLSVNTSAFPMTSANPTAFETRNLGQTLEVDPVLSEDSKSIDLNLAPEVTEELEPTFYTREGREETAYGVDHIMMPTFYTRKVTTQIEVIPGNYNILALQKPHDDEGDRIFVLLRADLIPIKE